MTERVVVKSGVSALELGSDLTNWFHLDSIFEFNPGNHLRQVAEITAFFIIPVILGLKCFAKLSITAISDLPVIIAFCRERMVNEHIRAIRG